MRTPIENLDLKKISSGYGMRTHPISKNKTMHYGVDLAYKSGTKVYAVKSGKVVVSKMQAGGKGLGNYIVILHTDNTYSLYAHLSVRAVQTGNIIREGQYIGMVGSTGDSTGPHLHFGMCKSYVAANVNQSKWFDPTPLLKQAIEEVDEVVTKTYIIVDGKKIEVSRILKDNENYIKLRDLDAKCNICTVSYDAQQKLPVIKTK